MSNNDNKQTILLTIVDPCQVAVATFVAVKTQTYKLNTNALTFSFAKPTITPTACNAGEIAWDSDYTIDIPKVIQDIVTVAPALGNTKSFTVAKTALTKYIGTHSITVTVKDEKTVLKNTLTIKLSITDECETATVTIPTLADITWSLGAKAKTLVFKKWVTNPSTCKDRMKYVLTVPTALGKVSTAKSDGLQLVLSGTSSATGVVAKHKVTLKIQGPAGTDIKSGSVTFTVTVGKAGTTATGGKVKTKLEKSPAFKLGPGAKGTVEAVTNVISVGATVFTAGTNAATATGPRAGGGGGRAGRARSNTGTGGGQGQG